MKSDTIERRIWRWFRIAPFRFRCLMVRFFAGRMFVLGNAKVNVPVDLTGNRNVYLFGCSMMELGSKEEAGISAL